MALRRLVTPGRLIASGLILLAVVATLWAVPSGEYIFLPDPAHSVDPLVTVSGGHKQRSPGGIYFVDVFIRKASLLERMFGGLHNGADLYPPSAVVGNGLSAAQQHRIDVGEMNTSQEVAAAVAFLALGRPVTLKPNGVLVYRLLADTQAATTLIGGEDGDVIVAVDGRRVLTPADLARVMRGKHPGAIVRLTILRGDAEEVVRIRTVRGRRGNRALIGIIPKQAKAVRKLPGRVKIDSEGVVGPSAGLAFALDIVQQLGRNVDRGHKVAATGEIHLDGSVGEIGGIKQKTIGAREAHVDVFLVPAGDNAREARKYAHGLRIIPVKSFQQALHALATLPAAG